MCLGQPQQEQPSANSSALRFQQLMLQQTKEFSASKDSDLNKDKELIFSYNSLQTRNYNPFCARPVPPDIGGICEISVTYS